MKRKIALLALLGTLASCHPHPAPATHGTAYTNGHWFDGTKFVDRTMYVTGDRFVEARPQTLDASVDLAGGFVVPPYGDGHNHWLEANLVDAYIATYLRDGVFYVKDMSVPPQIRDTFRAKVNIPGSVDYIAAHQGFTGPGGHPIEIVDSLVQFGILPAAWGPTHGDGEALFVVQSEADIDRVWPKLVASHPDFVKLFLVHSEEYAKRRDDASLSAKQRGLDPALVPGIVTRAHAGKLRVVAHIETAHDFHVAIAAGADEIAHMPFVDDAAPEVFRLADADVKAAGARHITIATTSDFLVDAKPGDVRVRVAKDNMDRLRAAGVTIAIGTDLFRQTAAFEVDLLAKLGIMTNLELLRSWSVETPRSIFPDRDLGRLEPGAEASFLVLGGDPLAAPANLHAIKLRVKQGAKLEPGSATIPPLGGN